MNTHQTSSTASFETDVMSSYKHSMFYLISTLLILVFCLAIPTQVEAASCGGVNQPGCKITFKRLKTCDKGLHLNLRSKRCVRNKRILPPKQKNCGKLGQMACRITATRPKACNLGLHRDKRTFRCVKNKRILPPKQKNCGKLNQYACKVTPTRLKACDFGLHRDKRTKRCAQNKSVLPPKQKNCGKLGQMACRITVTRPKACDFGLHRHKKTFRCVKNTGPIRGDRKNCGKLNQRACKKWERVIACDKGLRRYPPTGLCIKKKKVNIKNVVNTAKNVKNESIALIKIMATGYGCYFTNPPATAALKFAKNTAQKKNTFLKELKKAIKTKDANFGLLLGQSTCLKRVVAQADYQGYKTITLGYSGGASFGIGGFADNGFAFDIKKLNHYFKSPYKRKVPTPTFYQTKAYSGGIQAGLAGGFNLGLFKGANAADARGSDTHGVTFEAGAGIGGGTGIWFDYNGKLDGISASAIVGASGKAGAYNRINTSYYNLKGPTYVNCGGSNQRACKPWESVPACKGALKHNVTTGKCETKVTKRRVLNCGANGQRVCRIQERVPGCNKGLRIDLKRKICVVKR